MDNNPKDRLSILARAERAHREIVALCKGEHREGGKRWTMCIPRQMDDSDEVLSAPLDDIDYLLAENAQRLAQIAKLEIEVGLLRHELGDRR